MDKLSDHMFVFKGDGIINDFYGNYSEYRDLQKNEEKQSKFEEKKKKIQNKKIDKRKVSYKEKREYVELEKEIEKLESEKNELEESLLSPELEVDKIIEQL